MVTKSPTRTKAKPPKNAVDREIGEQEHDDLVNWLIVNRSDVVDYQFSLSDQVIDNKKKWAMAEWMDNWNERISQVKEFQSHEAAAIRKAAAALLVRAEKWLLTFATPPLPPEFGTTIIERWATQTEVYATASRGERSEKIVAFVDVTLDIERQETLSLSTPEWPYYLWASYGLSESGQKQLRMMNSMQFSGCEWQSNKGESYRVYYDVRATLPTLGEALQSLKTLRSFVETGSICLFAKDIPELWRDVLRNEGFLALSQDEVRDWMSKRCAHVE